MVLSWNLLWGHLRAPSRDLGGILDKSLQCQGAMGSAHCQGQAGGCGEEILSQGGEVLALEQQVCCAPAHGTEEFPPRLYLTQLLTPPGPG